MALKTGEKAPDFKLHSLTPEEKDISLNDYKGKNVVLLFFPQVFTGACTTEMCNMSDNMNVYNNLDAQILGISVDGTFPQKEFAQKNNIKFPLLSDYNREVIKKYDVTLPEFAHGMKETAQRAVYVIDKEGKIKHVEVTKAPGDQPDYDAIKQSLEK